MSPNCLYDCLAHVPRPQSEVQRLGSQLHESLSAQRALERNADAALGKHEQQLASTKRDFELKMKDVSMQQGMMLEQACRAAAQDSAQQSDDNWRRKFAAETTRFEQALRRMQQQNLQLSTRASSSKKMMSSACPAAD